MLDVSDLPELGQIALRYGTANTPGVGKRFETCRNIHTITKEVIALDYHVTEVDTYPPFRRELSMPES